MTPRYTSTQGSDPVARCHAPERRSSSVFSARSCARTSRRTPLVNTRRNKRIIRELLRVEGELNPELERELVDLRESSFRSEDMREGVRAFGEKRKPRWHGR